MSIEKMDSERERLKQSIEEMIRRMPDEFARHKDEFTGDGLREILDLLNQIEYRLKQ